MLGSLRRPHVQPPVFHRDPGPGRALPIDCQHDTWASVHGVHLDDLFDRLFGAPSWRQDGRAVVCDAKRAVRELKSDPAPARRGAPEPVDPGFASNPSGIGARSPSSPSKPRCRSIPMRCGDRSRSGWRSTIPMDRRGAGIRQTGQWGAAAALDRSARPYEDFGRWREGFASTRYERVRAGVLGGTVAIPWN